MPPERPYIPYDSPHNPLNIEDASFLQRTKKLQALCQLGDIYAIFRTFEQQEHRTLLEEQIQHLQRDLTLDQELSGIKTALTHEHWEMLTLIKLFDYDTFRHCIRTYSNIHQKLESTRPIGQYLKTELNTEHIDQITLLTAALLHDVGKIGLPLKEIILNNTLTEQEWRNHYLQFLCKQHQCSQEKAGEIIKHTFNDQTHANALRAKDIVPLACCLTPAQCTLLEQSHIDPQRTLGQIINIHQDFSGAIAQHYQQDETFIALVANHHERKLSPDEPFPVATSTIRIATIIRIADILDAIHAHRAYKKGSPFLTTLSLLIHQAEDGLIDPELTYLWIADDMEAFMRSQETYFTSLPDAIDREHRDDPDYTDSVKTRILEQEYASLAQIQTFLKKQIP